VSPVSATHDRLLSTAGDLFYGSGVTATGVDAVVRAAGVTKPTLYAHFPSKAALLTAALERRREQRTAELEAWVAGIDDIDARPVGVFGWFESFYRNAGSRGCGFLNAAAELSDPTDPAREVIRAEKQWLRDFLTELCRAAGLERPERLGSQLQLLIDGVAGRVVVEGAAAAEPAVADATAVADLLVGAARGSR
jgi:AcrR family transcriptional regulator